MDEWAQEVFLPVLEDELRSGTGDWDPPEFTESHPDDAECAVSGAAQSVKECIEAGIFKGGPVQQLELCQLRGQPIGQRYCVERRPKFLLLMDCWPGQRGRKAQVMSTRLLEAGVRIMTIPPHATLKLQPLDVSFNRQHKIFMHKITEEAHMRGVIRDITTRAGIANIQSLMWNQFSSIAYRDLIKNGWRNTDPDFSTAELFMPIEEGVDVVNAIQFGFDSSHKCEYQDENGDGCANHGFVQCSHCGKILCLQHFMERVCFHEESDDNLGELTYTEQAASSMSGPNREVFDDEYMDDGDDDADLDLITHPSLLRRLEQRTTTPEPRDELK